MTPQEQMTALIDAIEKTPEQPANWLNLAGIFLSNRMWEPFLSLFAQREVMVGGGAELLFQMLFSDIVAKTPQLYEALLEYDSEDYLSSNHLILHYASASMKINTGRIEEGRSVFKKIEAALKEYPTFGDGLPHLKDLGWLAEQFVSFAEISDTLETKKGIHLEPVTWIRAKNSRFSKDTPILLTTCDPKYFALYADKFLGALGSEGPVHFHVVNLDEAQAVSFQEQNPEYEISFSLEKYDLGGGSPFYASVRFLRIAEIMEEFDRDIAMLDIDVLGTSNLKQLFVHGQAADVTLFSDMSIIPWLRNWATFIYFKNSEASKRYQRIVHQLFKHKLEGAKWFIDQSLLNCVNQYVQKREEGIKVQFMRPEQGYKLHDFIIPDKDTEAKKGLRENADYD